MRTRRLIVQAPEGERELLFVGRVTVGRAPECDISVADTKISRRHAEFDATGPLPRVADLGSRNGLLVNGRKVAGADLATGDVVTIGDLRIRFEEVVPAATPASSSATADRTAALPRPPRDGAPAAGAPPAEAAPAPRPAVDDRTAILPRPPVAASGAQRRPPPEPDDRTVVTPRPSLPARHAAEHPPAREPRASMPGSAAPSEALPPAVPAPVTPTRAPAVRTADDVAVAPETGETTPAGAVILEAAAPAAAPVTSPAQAAAARGPRFSWGGLVVLACVALGGLGVLLGALPLMSSSSTTIDQLSRRQVRTLGGWVASAVRADGSVDEGVLADVLSQPGVESAAVLDVASGRAMAPGRLLGQAFDTLPTVGVQWKTIAAPVVTVSTGHADAFVPVEGGSRGYLAWVRYAPPSASESGVAVIVGLISTLVLALLTAMLIRRQTATTMQHFTRQVELVVSGASAKAMDGTLLPGIDRLPGVITYLLEQRRAGAAQAEAFGSSPTAAAGTALAPDAADGAPAAAVSGPAWIEMTPSLSVVATSSHAPDSGVRDWAAAPGRHLLDVLDAGPLCNAVVQGLGALGMAAGAEVTIPVLDKPPVTLRRETSTHVRVELATR